MKGTKRYGRRSTPEFMEPDLSEVTNKNPADEDLEDNDDSAVPRKREVKAQEVLICHVEHPDRLGCQSYLLSLPALQALGHILI